MHDCAQSRPEEEQAEVQKCGPYCSIVLAVPEVERKGEGAGLGLQCRMWLAGGQARESGGARGGNSRRIREMWRAGSAPPRR